MNDYDRLTRERLLAEVRSRLQTNLGPHSRDLFEHALESIRGFMPLPKGFGRRAGVTGHFKPVTSKPASRGRIKTGHSEVFNPYQTSGCRQAAF
jgi:hypothetical protein